jgi:ABC-2 type transport system permease protein
VPGRVVCLLQERLGEERVNRALRNLLQRHGFKDAPYPRSIDLVEALRAEARTEEEQNLITDLFERVILYDLKVTEPTAVRRADGKWGVTVHGAGRSEEVPRRRARRRDGDDARRTHRAGLFTAEPGRDALDAKHVIDMERRPIKSERRFCGS